MSWAMSSTCFFRSAISASRIASWNWLWKSAAMLRTLRVYWPSVRRTDGNSFGPMTISATTPISRNSVQEISNMETLRPARPSDPRQPPAECRRDEPLGTSGQAALDLASGPLRLGRRLMVDGFDRRVRLCGLGRVLVRHALLEGLDALGDVAHHVRNLA